MNQIEEVSYGFATVTAAEKRRLVDRHFEAIARRYDLADTLMSFGLDDRWRRFTVRRLGLKSGDHVLDLCGGTGGFAALAAREVGPPGTVTVCDVNGAMMRAGRPKAERGGGTILWVQGDAESLCFPNGTFDAVTVGFGVRNLVHVDRGFGEMLRVLRRGGKLAVLEFSVPGAWWLKRLYEFYSFGLMPLAGKVIAGTAAPFRYLAESIRVFPAPETLKTRLEETGFANVSFRRLTGSIVTVYTAEKHLEGVPHRL